MNQFFKSKISVEFNAEKLAAMRMYMGNKDLILEKEIEKSLMTMYDKYVPMQVREFISQKEENLPKPIKKPAKNSYEKPKNEAEEVLDFDV